MKRFATTALAGLALGASVLVPLTLAAPAQADVGSKGGDIIALAPRQMLLDTRSGIGAPKAQVGAAKTLTVSVLGAAGVPTSSVRAVELDVTALNPATTTYISVYPSDGTAPQDSDFNVPANGGSLSSAVLVPVGADGKIKIYNNAGSIDLAAAGEGYVTTSTAATGAGGYIPVTQTRIVSTTAGTGIAKATIAAGKTATATLTGGVIPTGTRTVFGTMQVSGTAVGGLVSTPVGVADSHGIMAFHTGSTSSAALLALSAAGQVTITNTSTAAINLYFDVQGYVSNDAHAGNGFRAVPSLSLARGASIAAGGDYDLQVGGRGGVPTAGAAAALLELTAKSSATGYVRAYPVESAAPGGVSALAFDATYRSDQAAVPLSRSGVVRIHNFGTAAATVYVDVKGWFDTDQSHVVDLAAHATPSIVQPIAGGDLDAAYITSSGALFHGNAKVDHLDQAQWSPVPSNFEAFTGQPAIARQTDGTLLVSLLHANNGEVWTFTVAAGLASWPTPTYLHTGGIMASAPASANLPDGSVVTFAVDASGGLWAVAGATGYWKLLSPAAGLVGTPTVVTTNNGVQIVDTTPAGTVTTASYVGGTLSAWTDLGGVGVTDKTAAMVNNGPRVRVVARQSDGTIVSKLQALNGTFPATWTQAGSAGQSPTFIGGPAVGIDFGSGTNPGTGKAFLLARSTQGYVYQVDETAEASGVWGEWYLVPGQNQTAGTDVAVTPYSGSANNYHWLGLYLDSTGVPLLVTPGLGVAGGA